MVDYLKFDSQARDAIPADVHMISGSHDKQTSADVSNVGAFQLPDPAGKPGGACTSALLKVLYKDKHAVAPMSWVDTLQRMRTILRGMGYDQIPQLTSSRMIDVKSTMYIVPPNSTGRRRAVLVGINYIGQQGQLSGCHNDVHNIKDYLINVQGFKEQDMLILMDDGRSHEPTRDNILKSLKRVTEYSEPGDVVFFHYSGHGGQVRDTSGDEEDGYDETLIPVDFKRSGQIIDDLLSDVLVKSLKQGVTLTALMDCCHSGTVLDLPYRFDADGSDAMIRDEKMDFGKFLGSAQEVVGCLVCVYCIMSMLGDFM
mmetsp:Transcript_11724/g.16432  ORF Transcript_11724/g.16432 Transcript_11724/m.16432 type:complete len:313 (+) Transcript_11724:187-1125(+)